MADYIVVKEFFAELNHERDRTPKAFRRGDTLSVMADSGGGLVIFNLTSAIGGKQYSVRRDIFETHTQPKKC